MIRTLISFGPVWEVDPLGALNAQKLVSNMSSPQVLLWMIFVDGNLPAIRIIRIRLAVRRPTMNNTIASPARRAVSRSAADGRRGGGGVDAWGEGCGACGCGEGVGELAVCVADALLACWLVVLLHVVD